ncbi:acyltransferase [Bifidobacterium longum]|uniref:acyltransferase family protein n=1 Tax=Bifidobacterium longum TaxID=216816 RepID=UPI001F44C40A|nr:acyltransferase [Bifidobacterium longum]UIP49996.1 acyltransferase [Bifidobacterium longum]
MFMILAHHFIVHNGYGVLKLPLGPERIFFQLVMAGGGKVGVVIFFSISAWFFLDKEQTIKSNLKRVWIMERELLFWSLILVMFYLVFDRADLSMKLMAKSVMPLSMGVWWYATAYAIFLTLLPFLAKGLKELGREYHLALAATVLVIWGLTSFIPKTLGDSALTGVFGFIYLFILISAYKWYMKPFTTKQVWLMTGIGLGFFLLYTAVSATLSLLGHDMGIFITSSWKLPVIMVGFGMFLLFDRVTFHSRVINRIAQSAFAVYLITDYAASEKLLWVRLFNLQNLYQQPLAILRILGILLAIYAACTLLDFIRQALFAVTIDRRRGHWFDLLCSKAAKHMHNHSSID